MLTFVLWVLVGAIAGVVARAMAPLAQKSMQAQSPVTILAVLGAMSPG